LDIHQNEIRSLLCDGGERLLAAFGFRDLLIGRSQHVANDLAIVRLVFDHQNPLAHAASSCRSTITGSLKVNVEP
jgi:hypothetical protein